jgi:serine/threonine protein kinase
MRPQRLGKYDLVHHLASGGMASVYLARISGLGGFERHLVLKTLKPEVADNDAFVAMFLDEARLVATLHHQHIAQVYDVGRADDGRYFLAMEYIHGETVKNVVETAVARAIRLPLEFGMTIACAAASGLHHAHERHGSDGVSLGIVHRDVTPSNVIVSYDGSIKLIDFGIAKAALRTTRTQTGFIKGKAGYMAPEQALGYPVDRRSDVFALGVLVYELTTQTRAFRAPSQFETVYRSVHGDLVPPTHVVPGFPPDLEHVIMTALETDPDDRYRDAAEMRRELERVADRLGLVLGDASVTRVLDQLYGRRPEPWLAALAAPVDAPPADDTDTVPLDLVQPGPTRVGFARGSATHDSIEHDESPTHRFVTASDVEPPSIEIDLQPARMLPPRVATVQLHAVQLVRRRRGRAIAIVALVLAAAGGLGLAMLAFGSDADEPPPTTSAHAAVAPTAPPPAPAHVVPTPAKQPAPSPIVAPPSAPPAPSEPPAAETITLHVTTEPTGATVVLDGVRLGTAPFTTTLPIKHATATLKVRMRHRVPIRQQVELDHDVTWDVRLPAAP